MTRPRVLLVDDDASIRRFVALALEELNIELIACASVEEALVALRQQPARLVLTDLMMPGRNGFDLLQRLKEEPHLRDGALLVVFSAGLNTSHRAQLAGFDIWRQLAKPVSLDALEACVREATSARVAPAATARGEPPTPTLTAHEQAALASHFGGDLSLFLAFRASCLAQFALDVQAGDAAAARQDVNTLHHLAHSLKSVLATLGHDTLSERARELETAASTADWAGCPPLWAEVRQGLTAI